MGERMFGRAVLARVRGSGGLGGRSIGGSRLINYNWKVEEAWTVVSDGARQTHKIERNEVNEVIRFVREVGKFLHKAFWCSNI
jgi:hypothetical protein